MYDCKGTEQANNKNKAAWSVVKAELGSKRKIQAFPDIAINNDSISVGKSIVDYFNSKFIEIGKSLGVHTDQFEAMVFVKQLIVAKFSILTL